MRKHMLLFLLLLVASFAFAANLNGSTAEQSIWSMSTSNTGNNQSVANYRNLLPPSNFQANVVGMDVNLTWEAPLTGEWITWCNPDETGNGIGTNGAAVFDVAHRYAASDLAAYQGSALTHVSFVPNELNCTYTIKIWAGTSASAPSSVIHSQVVNSPVIGSWNEVELTNAVQIPATGELWIGYESNTQAGHPAGCDDGPPVAGKGNMMYFDNQWIQLTDAGATLTFNWSIMGYVDFGARALTFAPTRNTRIGYNLYRDGDFLASIDEGEVLAYTDTVVEFGTYAYTVTTAYDTGESDPAGPVEVTVADLEAPLNLSYSITQNHVTLEWDSPQPPLEGEWITWSENENLGNSIGTDGSASFDVAQRFEASDLVQYIGSTLAKVMLVPSYEFCTYTVKVWTGGNASHPGTLMTTQVLNNPVIGAWNSVILHNPVVIYPDQELWIGYHVNTQGGFPAGCDNGPPVIGKGNMMNMSGWTTLDQVSASLLYNWQIQGLVVQGRGVKAVETPILVDNLTTSVPAEPLALGKSSPAKNRNAILIGYKVYRDGVHIGTIDDPQGTTFTQYSVPNGDYVYGVTGLYTTGESGAATIDVTVNLEMAPVVFEDSFEEYDDFAIAFGDWTLRDLDASPTYGFQDIEFPGSGSAFAYMVFNPSQTVPPITGITAYEGDKMAASFAAVNGPNNDYLITPQISLGDNSAVKFYARSHSSAYGLEKFKVAVSTMPNPAIMGGYQYISGADDVAAPTNWTEFYYDLSAYDNRDVYIAVRCVSPDVFVFYVDNFSVHSGEAHSNEDDTVPTLATQLMGNYPNPFNPETTISYSLKEAGAVNIEIYNVKGQLVKNLVNGDMNAGNHTVVWNGTDNNNRAVSSGVYFFKMNAGKYSSTKKMIMMK